MNYARIFVQLHDATPNSYNGWMQATKNKIAICHLQHVKHNNRKADFCNMATLDTLQCFFRVSFFLFFFFSVLTLHIRNTLVDGTTINTHL